MGVFSRLFSRQSSAGSAQPSRRGDERDHPDQEGFSLESQTFGEAPHLELSQDGADEGIKDATSDSDMSKPATAPAESAVWRSERVGTAERLADSDNVSTHAHSANQAAGTTADDEAKPDVSVAQSDATRADYRPAPSRPAAPEPRARLTSDVVPTMRRKTGAEAISDDVAGVHEANKVVDDAFSRWMNADPPTESEHAAAARESGLAIATTSEARDYASNTAGFARPAAYAAFDGDQKAWRETFASIAKLHIQPLRELMYHLSIGCTPRSWVTQTRPVLSPLFDAARQNAEEDLLDALSELDTALELAEAENTALVGPVSRGAIQQAYARLGTHLPDTFGPPRSSDGRRLLLLEALLLQVPTVHRRVLTKLYAAGISSIPQLLQGGAEELSRATGIDRPLANVIIEHVSRYSRERSGLDSVRLRQRVTEQLRTLIGRLSQLQTEFERAEVADNQTRKKAVRRARDSAVLELQRLIAELGEVELLEELKRGSVRAKVAQIQSFLQRASGLVTTSP